MRARFLAVLCLLGWFVALPRASAQGIAIASTLTLEEYWALIDRSLEAITQIQEEAQAASSRPILVELARTWDTVDRVNLPDGRTVALDASVLIAQLRQEPADLDRIRQSLEALKDARHVIPLAFDEDDAQSIALIVSLPEFQWQETKPFTVQQWVERFIAWLNELLNQWFGGQDVNGQAGAGTNVFISLVATVIFAALIFFVFRGIFTTLVGESTFAEEKEAGEAPLNAENALSRAQELSRGGDYRNAVRYLYLSSLLLLEERGLLRYDRTKTNWEVLRSVADQPHLKKPLQNVVNVFDQVWYGYQPLDQADYERYQADVQQIKEQRS